MKNVCIFLLLRMVEFMCHIASVTAWDFPLDISPIAMKFNHGYSNGAIPIRVNATTTISVPEYDTGYSLNQKFAYCINDEPDVLVKFYVDPPEGETLTIDAIGINGSIWDLSEKEVEFNGSGFSVTDPNYPDETNYQMFASGTAVPGSVNYNMHMWSWRVIAADGVPMSPYYMGSTTHDYYTLLDSPDSFVFQSGDETGVAWTDVLNLACNWASGETSYSACMSNLTQSIYSYSELYYSQTNYYGAGSTFYLQEMLDKIVTESPTFMDCQDYSNFLNVLAYSIGIPHSFLASFNSNGQAVKELLLNQFFLLAIKIRPHITGVCIKS